MISPPSIPRAASQDEIRPGVHHRLEDAPSLPDLDCSCHLVHRQPRDPHLMPPVACFLLGQPDAPELRVGEHGERDEPPDGCASGVMEEVLPEDLVVVVRDVGECRAAVHMIKAFAAEFDPQPFHLDQDAARASLFGGLVASGWHTAALTMRLLVAGELRIVGGLIGLGAEELRWPRPVHPGDAAAGRVRGAGAAALEIASRPWSGPGAEYNAEPGQQASDGHGRHHDRAPASLVTARPACGSIAASHHGSLGIVPRA